MDDSWYPLSWQELRLEDRDLVGIPVGRSQLGEMGADRRVPLSLGSPRQTSGGVLALIREPHVNPQFVQFLIPIQHHHHTGYRHHFTNSHLAPPIRAAGRRPGYTNHTPMLNANAAKIPLLIPRALGNGVSFRYAPLPACVVPALLDKS